MGSAYRWEVVTAAREWDSATNPYDLWKTTNDPEKDLYPGFRFDGKVINFNECLKKIDGANGADTTECVRTYTNSEGNPSNVEG